LDIGGQHGRRFVYLRHTHRPQRGHTPFVQAGAETSNTGAEEVKPDPGCSWKGHYERVGAGVGDKSMGSCRDCPPTPHSIGDPPNALHVLLLSDKLMRCFATGTDRCLDLRRNAFPLGGRVSAEWSRCPGSMAQRAMDSVVTLRQSSEGWMPATAQAQDQANFWGRERFLPESPQTLRATLCSSISSFLG